MIITSCRNSSLKSWDMCPRQYFIDYVLGWENKCGKAAGKGTVVHHIMEELAICEKNGKSFSGNINNLVKKHFKTHTAKSDLDFNNSDLNDCLKWTQKIIDDGFHPKEREIVDVEKFFEIEITKPWAAYNYTVNDKEIKGFFVVRGTIDLVTKLNDSTIEIIDLKTGRKRDFINDKDKTTTDLKHDTQLRIYEYACRILYPWAKQIIITMLYINDGGPYTIYFDDTDSAKTEQMLQRYFETIKNTEIPPCRRSWKCTKFCHFGKSTFEGTNIIPLKNHIDGKFMTKCDQIDYTLQHRSVDEVIQHMSYGSLVDNLDKYKQG